jgi:hypothetical protein
VTTNGCAESSAKLVEAVEQGQVLSCSTLSPGQLACSNDEQHVLPAEVIRDILRGRCAENPDPRGVQVSAARITGKLNLDGVECKVGLTLQGCWFDQPITAWGARLPWLWLYDSHLPGLFIDRLQVAGSVALDRIHVHGRDQVGAVAVRGASIGGHLLCQGAQLANDAGPALNAEATQVKGTVFLRDGCCATGQGEAGAVRLAGARIEGDLDCSDAQLSNRAGPALHAARLEIDGSVHLEDLHATGRGEDGAVRLRAANIRGNLLCRGAQLDNDTGPALDARKMQVSETVWLRDNFRAIGHGKDHAAVRLRRARVGTTLEVGKGIHNPDGPALDLRAASVTQLSLPQEAVGCSAEGNSRRQGTDSWLLLDGLTYTIIPRNAELGQWLAWLRYCAPYAAQPYQQLASVHRAVGEEADARKILIAQQDDLRARGDLGGGLAKARHWLLGLTIGYGYRTWRAFVGLAAVLVLAIGLGLLAGHIHGGDRWVAAHIDQAATACSTVEQVGLGVERAIPLLISNTRIRDRCVLDSHSIPANSSPPPAGSSSSPPGP